MALELTVSDAELMGVEDGQTTVDPGEHSLLLAQSAGKPLLQRLEDYYGGAHFALEEIQTLLRELKEVRQSAPEQLNGLLDRLEAVCEAALWCKGGITGIGD